MENDHLEILPSGKVYSTKMIVISTFCGGVLAGGYMIHQNFKTFDEARKGNLTVGFTIFALLLIGGTSLIPALDKIPVIYYNLFFTFIIGFISDRFQSRPVSNFIAAGGETYSTGKAVLVCIISIVILITVGLGIFLLQDILISQ